MSDVGPVRTSPSWTWSPWPQPWWPWRAPPLRSSRRPCAPEPRARRGSQCRAVLGQAARSLDVVLELGAGGEARNRRLADLHRLARARIAAGARGSGDLLKGAKTGEGDAISLRHFADDGLQDDLHGLRCGLATAEASLDGLDEISLVHRALHRVTWAGGGRHILIFAGCADQVDGRPQTAPRPPKRGPWCRCVATFLTRTAARGVLTRPG